MQTPSNSHGTAMGGQLGYGRVDEISVFTFTLAMAQAPEQSADAAA